MSGTMSWTRGAWVVVVTVIALLLVLCGATLTLASPDRAVSTAVASAVKPSARWLATARIALVRELHHAGAPAALAPLPDRGLRGSVSTTTATGSYNWSGYADTSTTTGSFTGVGGHWITPAISSCTAEDMIAVQWVGLDGLTDATVEQAGTLEWCFEGIATYFTWYEMYPAGSIDVGTSLRPGDQIFADVTRAGTTYTLSLTDSTTPANSFTETATCALTTCLDTSAEWVVERPQFEMTGLPPLGDFGTWTITNGIVREGTVVGSISSYDPVEISMVDSTDTYSLSAPSALNAAGNSFTSTWDNSY
jgi:hypothetical protein